MVELKVNMNEVNLKANGSGPMVCTEATLGIETLVSEIAEALECSFDEAMIKATKLIKMRHNLHKDEE